MAESSRSVRDRERRGALLVPLRNQAPTQVYYLSAGTLFKQCADPGVNAGECRL